jgi:hypothetical protein
MPGSRRSGAEPSPNRSTSLKEVCKQARLAHGSMAADAPTCVRALDPLTVDPFSAHVDHDALGRVPQRVFLARAQIGLR